MKTFQEQEQRIIQEGQARIFGKTNTIGLYKLILGIIEEAGEISELIDQESELPWMCIDHENMVEEIGDLLWYLINLSNFYGCTFEEILDYNERKLIVRYGKID